MYLLMLLATFMASIYGYNLSARPDYDRDIAKKKAMAIIFKFDTQYRAVRRVVVDILDGGLTTADGVFLPWVLPGDMFYAQFDSGEVGDNEDIHVFINQDGSEHLVYLRSKNKKNEDNIGAHNYVVGGRQMYDGSEMGMKLMCLDKQMYEADSQNCTSAEDEDGNVLSSCCDVNQAGGRYIVAYKRLDARWINRITGEISLDFISALSSKVYYDNIGIIRWGQTPGKNEMAWQFQGKINFQPVYAEDLKKWNEEHDNTQSYPVELRNRSAWTLPVGVFDSNFFQSKVGGTLQKICDATHPCLFKIQAF